MIRQEIVLKIPRITIHGVRGMVHRFFELYELLKFFESHVPINIHGFMENHVHIHARVHGVFFFLSDAKFMGSTISEI